MLEIIWYFVKIWLRGFAILFVLGSIALTVVLTIVLAGQTGWLEWLIGGACLIFLPLLFGIDTSADGS